MPLPGDVTHVPYGDAQALRAAVTDGDRPRRSSSPSRARTASSSRPPGYLKAARAITARHRHAARPRRGADRHRPYRALVRVPGPRGRPARRRHPREGPRRRTAARRDRRLRRAPPTCSSPASTARRSAATRSPAPPDSPYSTPSRTRGCWRTSSGRARSCGTESRALGPPVDRSCPGRGTSPGYRAHRAPRAPGAAGGSGRRVPGERARSRCRTADAAAEHR